MPKNDTGSTKQLFVGLLDEILGAGAWDDLVFGRRRDIPPKGALVAACPTLCFVTEGERPVRFQTDSGVEEAVLRPGNALFLEHGAWHAPAFGVHCLYVGVHFRTQHLRLHCTRHPDWTPGSGPDASFATYNTPGRIIRDAVDHLTDLCSVPDADREKALLVELLLRASRRELIESEASNISKSERLFLDVCDYLAESFREPINRDTVAFRFKVSPGYLSHLFKKHGDGFTGHLIRLRMAHARMLLRRQSITVREIAAQCGFGDQRYFITAFRKREGIPPGRYRDQHSG